MGTAADRIVDRLRQIPQDRGSLAHAGGGIDLLHARRAVQQHEHRVRRAAGQPQPSARQGPPHHEDNGGHGQDAQGQDQNLAQAREPLVHLLGGAQEDHGRPFHLPAAVEVNEVDDQRQDGHGQREQGRGLEKSHRAACLGVRERRKRTSTSS